MNGRLGDVIDFEYASQQITSKRNILSPILVEVMKELEIEATNYMQVSKNLEIIVDKVFIKISESRNDISRENIKVIITWLIQDMRNEIYEEFAAVNDSES